MPVSRDAARRGAELLRALVRCGCLGTGVETLGMLDDLCRYAEGDAMNDDDLTPDEAEMLRDANDSASILGDVVRERLAAHIKRLLVKHVRLQQAVWPGLPKWEPTAENPQQDFYEAVLEAMGATRDAEREALSTRPKDMLLFCPKCGLQHIDAPAPEADWANPPHKSHLCHGCGTVWRPADFATNGVAAIGTKGERDNWDGTTLRTRTAELEKALTPFAAIQILPDAPPDGWLATWGVLDTFPTVAEVQRAAALLADRSERKAA